MKTAFLVVALVMALAAPAAAECVQADVAGSWALIGSNQGAWSRCELEVADDGSYEGRCLGTGRPKRRGDAVTGALELAQDCSFMGTLEGQGFSQDISGGQLAPSGETGSGIVGYGKKRLNLGLHFVLVRIEL